MNGTRNEGMGTAARAAVVNRTHRVVRERAEALRERKKKARSLWIPLAVSAVFLPVLMTAVWTLLGEYDMIPDGLPDASSQIFVLLMWCLPLSALVLAVVWFRRGVARANDRRTA